MAGRSGLAAGRRERTLSLAPSAGRRRGVTFHRDVSSSPATGRLAAKPAQAEFIPAGKESTMRVLKTVFAALPVLAALLPPVLLCPLSYVKKGVSDDYSTQF